jgi:hypothetical protein
LKGSPWRPNNLAKPFDDPRGERESAEILKKLLALGLGRFEPNPLAAIAEAEQRGRRSDAEHQCCSSYPAPDPKEA